MATEIKGVSIVHPEGGYSLGSKKIIRKYVKVFYVKTDTKTDGPQTIMATTGLPIVGLTVYSHGTESDLTAVCKSKKAKRMKRSRFYWAVTCEFDNASDSQAQEDEEEQSGPVDRPYEIDWDAVVEEIALWKDLDDNAIVNSAGERFPEPVTAFIPFPMLTVTRWEATFTAATILAYVQHVNDDVWLGADSGSVLCESIRAKRIAEEGALLWQVTYQFKFSPLPWGHQAYILDQGNYFRTYPDPTKRAFLTEEGIAHTGNLDGAGGAAATGVYAFRSFKRAAEADFDALGLV